MLSRKAQNKWWSHPTVEAFLLVEKVKKKKKKELPHEFLDAFASPEVTSSLF